MLVRFGEELRCNKCHRDEKRRHIQERTRDDITQRDEPVHSISVSLNESDHDAVDDEAALVHAAQLHPAAFGLLYDRYVDRIYAYLWARTSSAEDAADLTQHVFVQALDALPRYRTGRVPFAAWIFRIARNATTDWRRRQRATVAWDLVPNALHPRAPDDLEAGVLRQESLIRLRTLLAALDAETREALILRFTAQLTLADVGAVIGKSEEATRKKIARALHTLKEQYHDDTP